MDLFHSLEDPIIVRGPLEEEEEEENKLLVMLEPLS